MCRRPLAGFFSRMCTGTPMASPNCPAAAQTRQCGCHSLLQPARQTESPCCLCPVSGHALCPYNQPVRAHAAFFSFNLLQNLLYIPSVHLLYIPSVRLLYTFCTFCTCLDAPQTLLRAERQAHLGETRGERRKASGAARPDRSAPMLSLSSRDAVRGGPNAANPSAQWERAGREGAYV